MWKFLKSEIIHDGYKYVKHNMYENDTKDILVDVSIMIFKTDKRRWKLVSIVAIDRYPTWQEIVEIKEYFIGVEKEAYQVIPKKSQHVNICEYCFHLWHCLDDNIMPE